MKEGEVAGGTLLWVGERWREDAREDRLSDLREPADLLIDDGELGAELGADDESVEEKERERGEDVISVEGWGEENGDNVVLLALGLSGEVRKGEVTAEALLDLPSLPLTLAKPLQSHK